MAFVYTLNSVTQVMDSDPLQSAEHLIPPGMVEQARGYYRLDPLTWRTKFGAHLNANMLHGATLTAVLTQMETRFAAQG
jgi:hypothetical protein